MSTPPLREALAIVDAASPLGDALVSEAYLALRDGGDVMALSAQPEHLTHFSRAITYAAIPDDLEEYAARLHGATAVFLVLEAHKDVEKLAASTIRAMRRAGIRRLIATAPLDALRYTVHGTREADAPRRERSLAEKQRERGQPSEPQTPPC